MTSSEYSIAVHREDIVFSDGLYRFKQSGQIVPSADLELLGITHDPGAQALARWEATEVHLAVEHALRLADED